MILLVVLLPLLLAPFGYTLEKKRASAGSWLVIAVCLACGAGLWLSAGRVLSVTGVMGFGLRFAAEGFRLIYALIALLMWACTSLLTPSYMQGHEHTPRYTLFTLLTLSGTLGVFLSDSLMTLFVFFELMSLCSYPWVAQEETKAAMDAAKTYLYIAMIGGMVMLMGLFLLPSGMAAQPFIKLSSDPTLALAGALMLVGFGAKAGMFPLHVWLPKAHPVAPAPASALLSGALTKTGVFGAILLSFTLMKGVAGWGLTILSLGAVTMLLGALLALISNDLKRTLACSSLSQIGFILVGLGAACMCTNEQAVALYGVSGHMFNHSLVKMGLFLLAGVIYHQRHTLSLSKLRGAGRGQPILHLCFIILGLSLAGVPPFSGYTSKTLLHEGILQAAKQTGSPLITGYEWVFLVSGGLTLCYMLKLYICLFWQKGEITEKARAPFAAIMSVALPTGLALFAGLAANAAVSPFTWIGNALCGMFGFTMEGGVEKASEGLYALHNLTGSLISIFIGLVLFVLTRRVWLSRKGEYLDRRPQWLDMENSLYRPLLRGLGAVGSKVAMALGGLTDALIPWLLAIMGYIAGLMGLSTDFVAAKLDKTVFTKKQREPLPNEHRLAYAVGSVLDEGAQALNRTVRKKRPIKHSYAALLAASGEEAARQSRRLTRSVSYGLMLFCLGLLIVLGYLLLPLA